MFISNDDLAAIRYKINQRVTYVDLERYAHNTRVAELEEQITKMKKRFDELYNFTYLLADECGCDIQWKPAVEAGDVPVKRSKR